MSEPKTSSPAVAKLEDRIKVYQQQESECIQKINTLNENRLKLSGAILSLFDQIAELQAEEEGAAKSPALAVLPKAPKSKSPLRHASKK